MKALGNVRNKGLPLHLAKLMNMSSDLCIENNVSHLILCISITLY